MAAIPGILVFGDSGQTVYFVNNNGASTPLNAFLTYGVAAPATYVNNVAFLGESSTGGSALHAFAVQTGTDLFGAAGIQVNGSIDAAPVVDESGNLYFTASNGLLYWTSAVNPGPSPTVGNLNAMNLGAGVTRRVYANVLSANATQLFLVTAGGIYAVTLGSWWPLIGTSAPTVAWNTDTSVQFTSSQVVLNDNLLMAVAGSMVYAYDTEAAPQSGVLPSPWSYVAPASVTGIFNIDCVHLLVADSAGGLHVVVMATGNLASTLGTTLSAAAVANSTLYNGRFLVSLASGDGLYVNQVAASPLGFTATQTQHVPVSGVNYSGPPFVVEGVIYFAGSDKNLYAYDLSSGIQLWKVALGSGASGTFLPAAIAPFDRTAQGQVALLLDGQQYFATFRNLLVAAKNNSLTDFSSPPSPPTFNNLVKAVGAAGFKSYVLGWESSWLGNLMMGNRDVGRFMSRRVTPSTPDPRFNQATKTALTGQTNVQVFLDPYPYTNWLNLPTWARVDTWIGYRSSHQKFAIICVNGTKFALVGGLNISTSYWDTAAHSYKKRGTRYSQPWHDVGVLLQGPVVAALEAEFDRRWARSGSSSASPGTSSYVKSATWLVDGDTSFNNVFTFPFNTVNDLPYADPTLTTPQVPVEALTTNYEYYVYPLRQILDRLVQQISQASDYLYFEGYAFHDAGVVKAVADRLQSAGPSLNVIVVIPNPVGGDQALMTRHAYTILSLAGGEWTAFTYQQAQPYVDLSTTGSLITLFPSAVPVTVQKSAVSALSVNVDARGLGYTTVTFILTGSATPQTISLLDITALQTPAYSSTSRVIFSYPRRLYPRGVLGPGYVFDPIYVHSKVALIDDTVALVGSANFTKRSMSYDGELSVMVSDPTQVAAMRTALFTHWGMTTANAWVADAQASMAATPTSSAAPALQMMLLQFADFPAKTNWSSADGLYYATYFGSLFEYEGVGF